MVNIHKNAHIVYNVISHMSTLVAASSVVRAILVAGITFAVAVVAITVAVSVVARHCIGVVLIYQTGALTEVDTF
ncbi:Hypothetical predicted protein [Octopus vulgaris]|uniref:Transmembrane protein n=1 Tax=Octopus vulgaris TaxID=6645 RepID=A0AA36AYY9_OCTVU|nr:Hypothetical predicted protein [Octopus vulgaris]